ncbi:recombination protein NinG [Comamonas sp. UBA7528]|uniref:recombination protein NinG n=1 Tax=Comamonas sp. UBA7528 TaxID=1946391 RepID=UPI0025BDE984|nr:recombination protein NinG [Comamonas sp. UBA7528]
MTFRRTRCPHCKGKLEQGQRIHPGCIDGYAEAQAAKAARADEKKARMAAKVERAETRRRKEALKTVPHLIKEAQIAFNAFIRERDRQAGHVCISSGRPLDWSGNAVDAGHYRSTGAASHLRFHEDNCHAQSKHDNQFLAGNAVDYRIRLVARIGLARVEALEADNQVRKWTRQELIAIRDEYRLKNKKLKKEGGA